MHIETVAYEIEWREFNRVSRDTPVRIPENHKCIFSAFEPGIRHARAEEQTTEAILQQINEILAASSTGKHRQRTVRALYLYLKARKIGRGENAWGGKPRTQQPETTQTVAPTASPTALTDTPQNQAPKPAPQTGATQQQEPDTTQGPTEPAPRHSPKALLAMKAIKATAEKFGTGENLERHIQEERIARLLANQNGTNTTQQPNTTETSTTSDNQNTTS